MEIRLRFYLDKLVKHRHNGCDGPARPMTVSTPPRCGGKPARLMCGIIWRVIYHERKKARG